MTLQTWKPSLATLLWSLALSLQLVSCRSAEPDPAPLPASYELSSAPPGARGARAAGTDAAPPRPGEGLLGESDADEDDPAEPEADAGSGSDAGLAPDAAGGVAL